MLEIFGVPFSAHTRKVLLVLQEKALPYELVPVIPVSNPPSGWQDLSPLGKIPVLRSSELTVADSSVICQYLERIHPAPALYPERPTALAQALWYEEFVDGALAPHVLRGLLVERAFARRLFDRAPDEAIIQRTLQHELPPKLAYLERNVDGPFLVGGALSIADITLASMLINYHFAGERLGSHPKLERYLQTLLRLPCFQRAIALELPAAEHIGVFDVGVLRDALR